MTFYLSDANFKMTGNQFIRLAFTLCLALCGCASKNKTSSQQQLQRAYIAGQQAATAQMQQQIQQASAPQVRVIGTVKNPVVPWYEGLTLGRALVDSQYQNPANPVSITIYRAGNAISIDPQSLLRGEDYPLYPSDVVVIQN